MAQFSAGDMFGYYWLIGEEKAIADKDKDGNNTASVTFTRLVANLVPGDEYYMLIQGSNSATAQIIKFNTEEKNEGSPDIIEVLPPVKDFNIGNLGSNIGKEYVEYNDHTIPPLPGKIDGYDKKILLNQDLIQSEGLKLSKKFNQQGSQQGGQQVMMLQSGNNGGATDADNAYIEMAGFSFAVQQFQNSGNNNAAIIETGNYNSSAIGQGLEALASYPIITKQGQYSFNVKTAYCIVTDQYPTSIIKGKLNYTWAGNPGYTKPLANINITLVECLVTDAQSGKTKVIMKGDYLGNNRSFLFTKIKTVKTGSDGSFNFEINNTNFNLGEIYTPVKAYEKGPYYYITGSKYGKDYLLNKGWVSFNTDPYNGPVRKVLRIIIEDEYAYLSPDNDITVKPLETVDLSTITSTIMSIGMKGKVVSKAGFYEPPTGVVSGAECYLLRPNDVADDPTFPEGEGNTANISGHLDEYPDYKILDKVETGSDGKFMFHNFISPHFKKLFFYFKTKDMAGTSHYKSLFSYPDQYIETSSTSMVAFNNDYTYTEGNLYEDIGLVPDNPIVKGQVVSDINITKGIDGAKCVIEVFAGGSAFTNSTGWSHDGGYFEFPFDDIFVSWMNAINWKIDSTVLTVTKNGYGYRDKLGNWTNNWRQQYGTGLLMTGKQIIANVVLAAAGTIKGEVICKTGNTSKRIPSYLQFLEYKTGGLIGEIIQYPDGTFYDPGIPALPGFQKLIVIPNDPAYFADTSVVFVKAGQQATNIQVEVFERLHRVKFIVKQKVKVGSGSTYVPVKGAIVELCDGQGTFTTADDGKVDLSFKNVSVDNLTMKISGPQGGGFIPKYITFKNLETETTVLLPNVFLEKGISLAGKVTLNGHPTSMARVYADVSYSPGMDSYSGNGYSYTSKSVFEADVNTDGTFTFNALPPEISGNVLPIYAVYSASDNGMQKKIGSGVAPVNTKDIDKSTENEIGQQIQLDATPPSTSQTTVGDYKLVSIPSQQPVILNLTTLDNIRLNNIWGFPMQPFMVQKTSNNHYKVWGVVKLKGYSPGFDIINEENIQFRIQNVEMKSNGNDNGVAVFDPVGDYASIANIRSFKVKYSKTFNTVLSSDDNNDLKISRKGAIISGTGVVNGYVHIVDNSFKYPSSYLSFDEADQTNQFYFYLPKGTNTIYPTIDVFAANTPGNGTQTPKFYLKRKNQSNLQFRFIGFQATADSRNSFIEGNKITLDATLLASMKNADAGSASAENAGSAAIEIHLPKLVLKDNMIEAVSTPEPIIVTLKDGGSVQTGQPWKLEVMNWSMDPTEGGLISKKCVLHTGKLDVPFYYFNLRSDFAYLNKPNLNDFNLGGKKINFIKSKATFGFNPSTGNDKKGHWQIIVSPEVIGMPVGTIENLSPNLSGLLELETVSLLSNGEDVFTIGPGAAGMKLYDMASFKPVMVYTIANGYEVIGNIGLQIPRVNTSLGAKLVFTNSGMKVNPINIWFTGKGNILFEPNMIETNNWMQKWETHKFTAYGKMSEPGKLEQVDVLLTHELQSSGAVTNIVESDRKPGQEIKIGESNTKLKDIKCAMHADAKDWDNFTFEGDFGGMDGMEGKNHTKFTVFGEIKASGQTLKATGLVNNSSSTFDGIEFTYDKGRIRGSLNITDKPFGSFTASGSLNILMDSNGWLFYGNATAPNVPLPDPCTANIGLLVGYYKSTIPSDVQDVVLHYAIRKELPQSIKDNKLLGFFSLAGRDLPIKGLDVDIPLVVATAYVNVPTAGIDGYAYMNLLSKPMFGVGIDGKIQVNFGLKAITCTDLTGSATACINAELNENNLTACAGISAELGLKQYAPLVVGCGGIIFDSTTSKEASFKFSLNPFDVQFNFGSNVCPLCK
jgi:hypothetical protein